MSALVGVSPFRVLFLKRSLLTLYRRLSSTEDKRAPRTPDGYHYVVGF